MKGQLNTSFIISKSKGCHADVGGGSHKITEPNSLSGLSLRWMIKECIAAKTGLIFDNKYLSTIGINMEPQLQPRAASPYNDGPEDLTMSVMTNLNSSLRDHEDTFASIYDQLRISRHWWILEYLPLTVSFKRPDGSWMCERS